jgi:DNA-binding IclR family transcriptional regulator
MLSPIFVQWTWHHRAFIADPNQLFRSMETVSDARSPAVLQRAFVLLRLLASGGRKGLSLSELSQLAGFAHATTHRLLRQLVLEGMALQNGSTRRYALGSMAFELGLAAYPHDIRAHSRSLLERLADRTEDSVFLSQRSFDDAVCVDLQPGPSPIRVVTLEIGTRRPLGAGAGGLAILASLPAAERDEVLQRVTPVLESHWSLGKSVLRDSIRLFDQEGYAFIRNRLHAGISAVGVPVRGELGQPIAALSVAALNERMRAPAISRVVDELKRAAALLEKALRRHGAGNFDARHHALPP